MAKDPTIGEFADMLWKACEQRGMNPVAISVTCTLGEWADTAAFTPHELSLNPSKCKEMAECKAEMLDWSIRDRSEDGGTVNE